MLKDDFHLLSSYEKDVFSSFVTLHPNLSIDGRLNIVKNIDFSVSQKIPSALFFISGTHRILHGIKESEGVSSLMDMSIIGYFVDSGVGYLSYGIKFDDLMLHYFFGNLDFVKVGGNVNE